MVPNSNYNIELNLSESAYFTKTYKIEENKIQGFVDGIYALEQAIYKVLNTEKYEYPIYSFDYGIELENLIGKDSLYVKSELRRRIQECLLGDERVQSVDNFSFEISGDTILCKFDVESIYGEITVTKEVNV